MKLEQACGLYLPGKEEMCTWFSFSMYYELIRVSLECPVHHKISLFI
jgi:hypothetical protein